MCCWRPLTETSNAATSPCFVVTATISPGQPIALLNRELVTVVPAVDGLLIVVVVVVGVVVGIGMQAKLPSVLTHLVFCVLQLSV